MVVTSATNANAASSDQRWLSSHYHSHHYSTSSSSNNDNYLPEGFGMDSPTLGQWIAPALLCALAYAFYNIFIKKGSYSINPVLGGVILQFVAALLGSVLLLSIAIQEGGTQNLSWDWRGVQWAICAGISVGLAEMISFFVSGMGVPAVQTIPIIIGGSVMFGTLLGMLLLGESLQWNGWLGVILLIGGICLVGIDPGARHAH
ncbi:EamA-like transporter [Fragilaria crotonensis]|nr:EamA-like transporter [Fragilaria crotonensis]